MADCEFCEYCCFLIVRTLEDDPVVAYRFIRTRLDYQASAEESNCLSCQEFYNAVLTSGDKVDDSTEIVLYAESDDGKGAVILRMARNSDFETLAFWKMKYTNEVKQMKCVERPGWKKGIMSLETRFDSIDNWLEDCINNREGSHKACFETRMPGYPSRLLDIRHLETSGHVRLISTVSWPTPLPEYTTLSHCWGPPTGPRPLQTTMANMCKHACGIQFKDLSRTFQDAILITRRVGQLFIWIDSLAIVQDDTDDWEREAAKMASIYANSFLTIAATSADDCEGGCDLNPWYLDIVEGTTDVRSEQAPDYSENFEKFCRWYSTPVGKRPDLGYRYRVKLKRLLMDEVHAPLHNRGWVMQERFLSRRILHMAHHHMLWQCQAAFDSEDVTIQGDLAKDRNKWIQNLSRVDESIPDPWWSLVKDYSKSDFTNSADRLPALAGVIEFQSSRFQDDALLGLWRKTIARDLSWSFTDKQRVFLRSKLPTWSWMSYTGEIKGPNQQEEMIFELRLESFAITWERQPYVSALIQYSLFVVSPTIQRTIDTSTSNNRKYSDMAEEDLKKMFREECPLRATFHDRLVGTQVTWNAPLERSSHNQITITYLLLYADTGRRRRRGDHVCFLVLQRVQDNAPFYRRMGVGYAFSRHDSWGPLDLDRDPMLPTPLIDWVLETWEQLTLELR